MSEAILTTIFSREGLRVCISVDQDDWIKVDFGQDLSFFSVPRDQAIKLANAILQLAKLP